MQRSRRIEFVENRVVDGDASPVRAVPRDTRLTGDLDALLDHRPTFRGSVRGYDRLEVDNYVSWAEGELVAAQREREHLLDRVSAAGAELEISRRLLAERPPARTSVSERVGEVLRLAEEQAAQVLEAADAEAGRIIAEARLEADARLRKAREIKELAVQAADQLRAAAQEDRAAAAALLAEAQGRADALLQEAAEERERLAGEAAEERERAAADAAREREEIDAEVAELQQRRELVQAALRGLTDRLGEALRAVGVPDPDDLVLAGGDQEAVPA